jgi:hypothetical protein
VTPKVLQALLIFKILFCWNASTFRFMVKNSIWEYWTLTASPYLQAHFQFCLNELNCWSHDRNSLRRNEDTDWNLDRLQTHQQFSKKNCFRLFVSSLKLDHGPVSTANERNLAKRITSAAFCPLKDKQPSQRTSAIKQLYENKWPLQGKNYCPYCDPRDTETRVQSHVPFHISVSRTTFTFWNHQGHLWCQKH